MQKLNEIIKSLDGKAVSSYTKLYGRYERNGIVYHIRNVYGGQFKYAEISVEIPRERLLGEYQPTVLDRTALTSYIMREFSLAAHMANDAMQQSDSNVQKGFFLVYSFGSRVLPNSVVQVGEDNVSISMTVKLPFNSSAYNTGQRGDPVLGIKPQSGSALALSAQAQKDSFNNRKKGVISEKALKLLLSKNLPALVESFVSDFDQSSLAQAIALWRNQEYIRRYLKNNGYVCFIANGSVLPRKGKTDYKDAKNAIPFVSPQSLEIGISLPSGECICGMAIPRGITLITGDAYHGKSTILEALREGVYNHVPGDGREYVISDSTAMSIQAEDGRSIKSTDISFFLRRLPVKAIAPQRFATDNASGSTSQAAAVTEALEMGCRLMLFDEDRSANNFMYKDEKMRSVIRDASTLPFIDNARMFFERHGISSIIVVGASGEYFCIADTVVLVENFIVSEYTDYAKCNKHTPPAFSPLPRTVDLAEIRRICLARGVEIKDDATVKFGGESINVLEIVPHLTRGQLEFICAFIYHLTVMEHTGGTQLRDAVTRLYQKIHAQGMELICQAGFKGTSSALEYVRPEDILAVLYRLKAIRFGVRQ